jgi:hypothetical protein
MKKKKKIITFVVIVVFVLLAVGACIYLYVKNNNKEEVVQTKEVKVLNSIEGYGITLSDADTELYKTEFEALRKNLESNKVNMEEYAKSVSKMFIIDLYTLNNKLNKYDVGGAEFVYPNILDNYKLNVEDTLYKYMEDNSKNKGTQQLPEVKSITVDSIKQDKYTIKSENKTYDAYKVELSWKYIKDLNYDDEATLYVINVDDKLYVAEKK